MGVEVIKFKEVFRYKQKPLMENYMDKNTELVARADTRSAKVLPKSLKSIYWENKWRMSEEKNE